MGIVFCCYYVTSIIILWVLRVFFFQAEDGIRDLVRSRGLGDVYKRQGQRDAPRCSWVQLIEFSDFLLII